ncbi:MAG: DUF4197 domain-containing protein [Saprospiraceae bacterium]|nr:DUF4197 domain-containing protein [Saprospiraceae bacterium]
MTKKSLLFLLALLIGQFAHAQLGNVLKKAKDVVTDAADGGLSQDEAGNGLKEALNAGVAEAVDFLSAKDGYFKSPYKILVPDEAQKVVSKLKNVPGFGNVEQDLTERMNRAAEDAAIKAKPIFIAAIKGMTFQDAMNILMGNQDAATRYLEKSTTSKLYAEFKPIIQESLDKVNAREYWKSAVTAYNKIPFVDKTNPDLDDHVTKKALVGLFSLVEKKEKNIRSDVSLRNTDLLKKVFAKQDKK